MVRLMITPANGRGLVGLDRVYATYPTKADCVVLLERLRWQGNPQCPYCNSTRTSPMPKEDRHHCNNCSTAFSVTVNTAFHHTHLPLQKWFAVVSLVLKSRRSVSALSVGARGR